jgi:hypothetical protein
MRVAVGSVVVALVASVGFAACGSSSPPSSSPPSSGSSSITPDVAVTAPSVEASPHAEVDRWDAAYSFLSAQTRAIEISCAWLTADGSSTAPAPRPVEFYDFSEPSAWSDHLVTRNDPFPQGTFQYCSATVPDAVPYGASGIRMFLAQFGLRFAADPSSASDLTSIEIAYAGQDADDPDLIYRDMPGLFGLRMALSALGQDAFIPGTSEIVRPTDEPTAAEYLRYATPLLDWYQYAS